MQRCLTLLVGRVPKRLQTHKLDLEAGQPVGDVLLRVALQAHARKHTQTETEAHTRWTNSNSEVKD